MNMKRFALAVVCVFAVTFAFDFVVHGVVLESTYKSLAHLWRPEAEMQSLMHVMLLTQFLFSLMFAFIFTRNYEGRDAGEGVRYGLYMGLFFGVSQLATYCYLPIPFSLALTWAVAPVVWGVAAGMVLSLTYREDAATA